MNKQIEEAQLLANFHSFEYLKEKEELFEDFYDYYTTDIYDPTNAKECFDIMTTYLIAMSMKELDFSKPTHIDGLSGEEEYLALKN